MTVIGRRQDCDLMIPLNEISRKHCRIIREKPVELPCACGTPNRSIPSTRSPRFAN